MVTNKNNPSVCVKCGKQRIVVSTRTEKIGNSVVTYQETSCPDPECQKKVEIFLAQEQEKRHISFLQRQKKFAPKV
ncbi:MAG: hypothetical protein ABSC49_01360 [Candidatus Microgenomates bacterium]|jgi:hypothetical protein